MHSSLYKVQPGILLMHQDVAKAPQVEKLLFSDNCGSNLHKRLICLKAVKKREKMEIRTCLFFYLRLWVAFNITEVFLTVLNSQ